MAGHATAAVPLLAARDDPQRVIGQRPLKLQRLGAGAVNHVSISPGVVRMTGMALG